MLKHTAKPLKMGKIIAYFQLSAAFAHFCHRLPCLLTCWLSCSPFPKLKPDASQTVARPPPHCGRPPVPCGVHWLVICQRGCSSSDPATAKGGAMVQDIQNRQRWCNGVRFLSLIYINKVKRAILSINTKILRFFEEKRKKRGKKFAYLKLLF